MKVLIKLLLALGVLNSDRLTRLANKKGLRDLQNMSDKTEEPTFTEKKQEKEVDFSKETDEAIEKARNLVKQGKSKLQEALDLLMVLEKQTRMVCTFYYYF